MKRRALLRALLWALPIAPLAIKGIAAETPTPPVEPDFPEGYKTFVTVPNRIYGIARAPVVRWSQVQDPTVWITPADINANV